MLAILFGLIVIGATFGIILYNALIKKQILVKEAWSGIDVQLKRRYNLIPNLISTVKGYSRHEKTLLEEVTNARTAAMDAQGVRNQGQAENMLTRTLRSIFALAENYPDLKASQNFLELQQALSKIEDEIQLARRYYNGTVREYNYAVQSFPSMLIANAFNFKKTEFFEIDYATERKAPDVQF